MIRRLFGITAALVWCADFWAFVFGLQTVGIIFLKVGLFCFAAYLLLKIRQRTSAERI